MNKPFFTLKSDDLLFINFSFLAGSFVFFIALMTLNSHTIISIFIILVSLYAIAKVGLFGKFKIYQNKIFYDRGAILGKIEINLEDITCYCCYDNLFTSVLTICKKGKYFDKALIITPLSFKQSEQIGELLNFFGSFFR